MCVGNKSCGMKEREEPLDCIMMAQLYLGLLLPPAMWKKQFSKAKWTKQRIHNNSGGKHQTTCKYASETRIVVKLEN